MPTETFDGEPLYVEGQTPDDAEITRRRSTWFEPYHAALGDQIARLRRGGPIVLYDAHSIRSIMPRLFDGELPVFNIGDNGGMTCDLALTRAVTDVCAATRLGHIVNGRFKGGWTTRHYGRRAEGVHAIQMELADRGYMADPAGPVTEASWPSPYNATVAAPMREHLRSVLTACLAFARSARS
ncbi:hypothetical protein BH10PSE2_BH10PSE2_16090 [soil metagenome]